MFENTFYVQMPAVLSVGGQKIGKQIIEKT